MAYFGRDKIQPITTYDLIWAKKISQYDVNRSLHEEARANLLDDKSTRGERPSGESAWIAQNLVILAEGQMCE